jgi:hypothetical protein
MRSKQNWDWVIALTANSASKSAPQALTYAMDFNTSVLAVVLVLMFVMTS